MTTKKEITLEGLVRSLGIMLVIGLAYLLMRKLSSVLIPFFVAWIVAYLLYPIVCFFQYRCKLRYRGLSIVVTLLLIVGTIALAFRLFIPLALAEWDRLQHIIAGYVVTQTEGVDINYFIEHYIAPYINLKELPSMLTFNDINAFLEVRIPQLLNFISRSLNALIGFIASLIAIIYLFFILADYENMSNGVLRLVPKAQRSFVRGMVHDVEQGMNKYFRGQSLIALCVGILFAIGFSIIGFPMAIPLGLFMGMLNLVPYMQIVGFVPAIVLALLQAYDTGRSFWFIILAFTIVVCIVQSIQDWVLTPRIMGKVTGLNGAVILLSLSVWGALLGIVGLIIALPATTLLISYYRRYVLHENDDIHPQDP